MSAVFLKLTRARRKSARASGPVLRNSRASRFGHRAQDRKLARVLRELDEIRERVARDAEPFSPGIARIIAALHRVLVGTLGHIGAMITGCLTKARGGLVRGPAFRAV